MQEVYLKWDELYIKNKPKLEDRRITKYSNTAQVCPYEAETHIIWKEIQRSIIEATWFGYTFSQNIV